MNSDLETDNASGGNMLLCGGLEWYMASQGFQGYLSGQNGEGQKVGREKKHTLGHFPQEETCLKCRRHFAFLPQAAYSELDLNSYVTP